MFWVVIGLLLVVGYTYRYDCAISATACSRADAGARGDAHGGAVEISAERAANFWSSPKSMAHASRPSTHGAQRPWC